MYNVNNFASMRISIAAPDQIREWSRGEVKKPETINYRTLKPERDGLFCEKIFGPTKDYECHCGKYKRIRYKGVVCDRCGVEVTRSKVRRERMGHIELAAPCTHIWFFKGIPSRLGLILDMSPRSLEKVIYFVSYLVIDPGETPFSEKQLLSESEYREACLKYEGGFVAGMGAEAIKELLAKIDVAEEVKKLKKEVKESTGQRKKRAIKRLEVMDGLLKANIKPEWLVMDVIPVIPPDLRPMVQLDGGRFATSDLNDLYRRVINRNNRLKRLLDLGAPDIIIRNEKRMLQEAVDALIDNGRRGRPVTGAGNRPLKSLSDMLKGKQGRFRQNLLGKRVDYSGRSVIVVGPELKLHQCGLPKKMALELFKPFVMKGLVDKGLAHNIKNAKRMVENFDDEVWGVLEEVIEDHPVLLNRAPTLHRLGIQAFEPVLVEGKAIKLHPLVCTAYNADFDGDQMAVHVPLSAEAQAEARLLMLSTNNLLAPSDGQPITVPTQDMVLGIFYLTTINDGEKGEGKIFASPEEAIKAYATGKIALQARIKVRINGKIIETSAGRVIFNNALPEDMEFINEHVDKGKIGDIVAELHENYGNTKTAEALDNIKELGFNYATKSGITIAISDASIPEDKEEILKKAEEEVWNIEQHYKRGAITENERYQKVVDIWNKAKDDLTDALLKTLDKNNNIYIMAISGARGNISQISQLAGMRGLMADPSGKILDIPIRSSFREGLNVTEFFISTHGARKGLADTAIRTADSGYLTRRLVDVAQDVIIREADCGTEEGITVRAIGRQGHEAIESLAERCIGRVAAEDIINQETGEVLVARNEIITKGKMQKIEESGIEEVKIRSILTCDTEHGVCQQCYGINLATGRLVDIGEAIGIVAAQSIGEPGTQLTMRTFHTGGVAGDDITQGLPRVEELFEARTPKGQAIITEKEGYVKIISKKNTRRVVIEDEEGKKKTYQIPYGSQIIVKDGAYVQVGDKLTEGPLDPSMLLKIKGERAVQKYILEEIQNVYRSQGVETNDKHIEVIIRQMMRKVRVITPGDTDFLPGSLINKHELKEENNRVLAENGETATVKPEILGITKASLATDSFLSAASFQETTRVLTEAALEGKVDRLLGLKENVIIGQLIPAGTGMRRYREIDLVDEKGLPFNNMMEEIAEESELI
ncbi:MAG TPA: DNA-directed RNA polymerase subunit beta' [Halanaerobiaceae bacterium]|nr:DNA-directed RNA polymerase subunit beta' [Halanaerobiaceae bacterium]HOA40476.1 DNA-directed RNA polymerase subunit beta' [Halanaerobiales bacterium]HPZ62681.1 DNA-directed RNA polymerase subunit beta' [Halanaerobiales bacterium]HQD03489.1 DNA-directed RNA polymerase subunit beta' [Halanaerobiales bacterium]